MKVLVTGGRGYLGHHVVWQLRQRKHEVTVADLDLFTFPVSTHRKDYRDFSIEELASFDTVIHLAWFSSAGSDTAPLQRKHAIDTEMFFDRCKEAKVKHFIFASTASVYGYANGLVSEVSKVEPTCAYGEMKLRVERYLEKSPSKDTRLTFLRKGTLMGTSKRLRLDLCANAFVYSAVKDRCTGAGNAPLEVFAAVCERMGIETGVDLFKLMDVAEDLVVPMMDHVVRVDRDSLTLGFAGVYSTFLLHAKRAAQRFGVPARDILVELGRKKMIAGQEDMITDTAMTMAKARGLLQDVAA